VKLVESVREHGGTVYVFSALHVTGIQLNQLSGVAAILRYPLPDLDQLEIDAAILCGEAVPLDMEQGGGKEQGEGEEIEGAKSEEYDDDDDDDDDDERLEQVIYQRVREDVADMGL
jgi:protein pelota